MAGLNVALYSRKGLGLEYGGPSRAALALYSRLTPSEVSLTVLHRSQSSRREFAVPELQEEVALVFGRRESVGLAVAVTRGAAWLRRNSDKIDILHCLTAFQDAFSLALTAESLGIPAVVKPAAYHSEFLERSTRARILRLVALRRKLAARISAYVAISTEIADELISIGVAKSHVHHIPNGVDVARFRPIGPKERLEARTYWGLEEGPLILFSGGLVRRKRPHLLLDLLGEPWAREARLQCLFLGPAGEMDYYSSLVEAGSRCEGRARFLGFRRDPEEVVPMADVLVLPSTNEGMSNAVLEAMACGVPAIVSPCSGMADLIEDCQNGVILKRDEDLGRVVREISCDEPARSVMGQAARETITRRFSVERVAASHLDLFRSLAK